MRAKLRPRLQQITIVLATLFATGACTLSPLKLDGQATAPTLDGFGNATLVPSQANESARKLFAQGMAQVYAFNEKEAIRSFKAALAQDRSCALCAWGIALKMGPNINNTERGELAEAAKYVDYALKHSEGASERDRALIESLAVRYGSGQGSAPATQAEDICRTPGSAAAHPLDAAYAAAMRQLVARFPADPDVLSQYAEAEMVATPGDWYKDGKPSGRIGELANLVELGLQQHPDHVGLNHYMIHSVDAVQVAARAVAAADRLGALAPKSPHLLHMPSHTYAHVGRYADATRVNQLAVAADEALALELKRQNFSVTKDWRGHNTHFQWFGALMEGRGELALSTARAAAGRSQWDSEFSEYIRSLPMLTLLHLQHWDALLKEPLPTGGKGVATTLGEMARGIAFARSGDLASAKAALARLEPAAEALAVKQVGTSGAPRIVRSIARTAPLQLRAEIAFAERRIDDALAAQQQAVQASTDADATEPPLFASSARHRLGDMQLQAKRYADAERTFRDDLAKRPANGWALHGLAKSLSAQDKQDEMRLVQRDLQTSWALADGALRAR